MTDEEAAKLSAQANAMFGVAPAHAAPDPRAQQLSDLRARLMSAYAAPSPVAGHGSDPSVNALAGNVPQQQPQAAPDPYAGISALANRQFAGTNAALAAPSPLNPADHDPTSSALANLYTSNMAPSVAKRAEPKREPSFKDGMATLQDRLAMLGQRGNGGI